MLEEKDRVPDYRNSPVASDEVPGNFVFGADPNINNLPKVVDINEDWDFDGSVG